MCVLSPPSDWSQNRGGKACQAVVMALVPSARYFGEYTNLYMKILFAFMLSEEAKYNRSIPSQ